MLRRAARGLTHTVRVYILATFPGYTPSRAIVPLRKFEVPDVVEFVVEFGALPNCPGTVRLQNHIVLQYAVAWSAR